MSHKCDRVNCILAPHVLEHMSKSDDKEVREAAVEQAALSESIRTMRAFMPRERKAVIGAVEAGGQKRREVYSMKGKPPSPYYLPGKPARMEGENPKKKDDAVSEAYDYSGLVYDFYFQLFNRNSIDDRGMPLISSVHFGRRYNNAFWNGQQMVYGDGDNKVFQGFTQGLDVIGHELTHGVVDSTSDLIYFAQPGALNESFADVFGVLVKQWSLQQGASEADWLVGADILVPAPTRQALRSMKDPGTAYQDDPYLGTDPQPGHMDNIYTGDLDNGGVHINSGIPNRAFYLAATKIGGKAWEKPAQIWYQAMLALSPQSNFSHAAQATLNIAAQLFGSGGAEHTAVGEAWSEVGISL